MKRKDKTSDMTPFARITFDDYDINDIIDYVGYDKYSYAKLDSVVIPRLYRMFNYCPMSDCQEVIANLKDEYSSDMLDDIGVENKLYVEQAVHQVSIAKALSMPDKDKQLKIDDWKASSKFDIDDVKRNLTNSMKRDLKYKMFDAIMGGYEDRRFSKSSVETKSESLEFVLNDILSSCIERGDSDMIRGVHFAEEFVRKILMRRNFSDNTWTMFNFAYTIDNRSYSEDAFDSVSR